jgi:hypothetical protein
MVPPWGTPIFFSFGLVHFNFKERKRSALRALRARSANQNKGVFLSKNQYFCSSGGRALYRVSAALLWKMDCDRQDEPG